MERMPSLSVSAQAQADLGRVNEKLEAAIESLTRGGPLDPQSSVEPCCALLREAASFLEKVHRARPVAPAGPVLVSLLRQVQARCARVQLLLDAAAALCRGWLQASPAADADYTPEGAWARVSAPVRLRLEA
jgi:hypothetical protein